MQEIFFLFLLILSLQVSASEDKKASIFETDISRISGVSSRSFKGKEIKITTITIGADTDKISNRFLVMGGLHGNEVLTIKFVRWLITRVKESKSKLIQLPKGTVIDFLSEANPDSSGYLRNNLNGVNLNRNFSVLWGLSKEPMGTSPFSEPETRAIKSLHLARKYSAAIDVHGYLNWIVTPSDLKPGSYGYRSRYQRWQKSVSDNLNILPGYFIKKAADLGDGGAFEDWSFWNQGTLALCLELRYPIRYFRFNKIERFDSFISYESFIHKMFEAAISINSEYEIASGDTPLKIDSSGIQ